MVANLLKIINSFFGVLLWPFSRLPAAWGLLLISVLTGLLMLLVYKRTSNQPGIHRIKNQLKASLLELRLYQDDVKLSLIALKNIFISNIIYIRFAVKPILVIAVPMLLLLVQLAVRYNHRPLRMGEETIIKITVQENISLFDVVLQETEVVQVMAPPLRNPAENQIYWKIKALDGRGGTVAVSYAGETATDALVVGDGVHPIVEKRIGGKSMYKLVYLPNQSLASNSFIQEMTIFYPKRTFNIIRIKINWFVYFLMVSLITGFSLKRLFRVEM